MQMRSSDTKTKRLSEIKSLKLKKFNMFCKKLFRINSNLKYKISAKKLLIIVSVMKTFSWIISIKIPRIRKQLINKGFITASVTLNKTLKTKKLEMVVRMQRALQKNKLNNLRFYNLKKSKANISSTISFTIKTSIGFLIGKLKLLN